MRNGRVDLRQRFREPRFSRVAHPPHPAPPRMIDRRTLLAASLFACTPALPSMARSCARAWHDDCLRLSSGRTLGIRQFGDLNGRPVFYFHGLPGSRMEAGLIAPEVVSSGVRLISIDRPGIGRSSFYANRRICDWPRDVLTVANYLGLGGQTFGVMGMSGGAPYAAVCARMIPDRIHHVAIVSGHSPMCNVCLCPEGNQDRMIRCAARRPRIAKVAYSGIRRRMLRNPHRTIEKLTEAWTEADRRLVLGSCELRELMIIEIKEALRCGVQGVYTEVNRLACDWGFRLSDIRHPSVSIWQGACDELTPASMGHYFHQQIAGSELRVDACGGHITNLKDNACDILARL